MFLVSCTFAPAQWDILKIISYFIGRRLCDVIESGDVSETDNLLQPPLVRPLLHHHGGGPPPRTDH